MANAAGIFYGSAGVFALDERAGGGSRALSTYGSAKFPGEMVRPVYGFDGYSPAQADYSALDRNRLLWRARAPSGRIEFDGGQTVAFSYRYLFGIDAQSGALRWAYDHPRVELVAAEHAGRALFVCALDGQLEALDAHSGAPVWRARLPGAVRVRGASFDADGFAPAPPADGAAVRPNLADTLTRIVRDRDR